VRGWFAREPPPGIGIVGGKVSGGLLVLDFEFLDFFEEWRELVDAANSGLVARLPIVRTPGKGEVGGRHVYARTSGPAVPTGKLARITRQEAELRTGDPGRTTAIEVKAEKGYVLSVGSPAACYPTGRRYRHISGPSIEETPTLTEVEVNLLLDCARALERGDKACADPPQSVADTEIKGVRPGDEFNRRADWRRDVLGPGWKTVRENGEIIYLCRPGKDAGVSATIGYCHSKRTGPKLYVFSTNAEPFEAERSYSKFEAYALLNHGGDFKAAARELARQGYGERLPINANGKEKFPKGDADSAKGKKDSQATRLVRYAREALDLFHTPEDQAFATMKEKPHQNWALRSRTARQSLSRLFYLREEAAPVGEVTQNAINTLEGIAVHDGPRLRVFTRLAEYEGKIFLDLGDDRWRAVAINPDGWQVVEEYPVRFRRSRGTLPLPTPVRGGSVDDLRPHVNVASDQHWRLLVAWLVACLRPRGPYPVLVLTGEQGSAKTCLGKLLRSLVDPCVAPLRSEPREVRDLMIAATHSWVVAFDNLSRLWQWLSDSLCRLATGGGFATRELYSDQEEILFDVTRPVITTSIEDVVTSSDLLDRSISLALIPIPDTKRCTEEQLWGQFESARPGILGGLLDAVVAGLRNLPSVKLVALPRLADFALWAEAVGRGIGWKPGSILHAYRGNVRDTNELALGESPLVTPLRRFHDERSQQEWAGSATELLAELVKLVDPKIAASEDWPKRPNGLGGKLRRLAPNLRKTGLNIEFGHTGAVRQITLSAVKKSFHR
jgi:hypothetical protein